MLGMGVSWTSLIIVLVALFLAITGHRTENGGSLTFKEGLRTGFMVVVISNLMFYVFFYLLLKIDPELVTILKQRIDALNQNNGMNIHWEIEDLKSESGKPKGTKVMLKHLIQE